MNGQPQALRAQKPRARASGPERRSSASTSSRCSNTSAHASRTWLPRCRPSRARTRCSRSVAVVPTPDPRRRDRSARAPSRRPGSRCLSAAGPGQRSSRRSPPRTTSPTRAGVVGQRDVVDPDAEALVGRGVRRHGDRDLDPLLGAPPGRRAPTAFQRPGALPSPRSSPLAAGGRAVVAGRPPLVLVVGQERVRPPASPTRRRVGRAAGPTSSDVSSSASASVVQSSSSSAWIVDEHVVVVRLEVVQHPERDVCARSATVRSTSCMQPLVGRVVRARGHGPVAGVRRERCRARAIQARHLRRARPTAGGHRVVDRAGARRGASPCCQVSGRRHRARRRGCTPRPCGRRERLGEAVDGRGLSSLRRGGRRRRRCRCCAPSQYSQEVVLLTAMQDGCWCLAVAALPPPGTGCTRRPRRTAAGVLARVEQLAALVEEVAHAVLGVHRHPGDAPASRPVRPVHAARSRRPCTRPRVSSGSGTPGCAAPCGRGVHVVDVVVRCRQPVEQAPGGSSR